MIEEINKKLGLLVGKKNIVLTRRGNKALKFILKDLKAQGKKKILIQDQGGWMTYPQYIEELKFELVYVKTDYGLCNLDELEHLADSDSVILINSMPGYFVYENMEKIVEIAKKKSAVLVNDVSGSIGSEEAKYGDFIFGSFGRWKPINLEYGGFIAGEIDLDSVFDQSYEKELIKKIDELSERIKLLKNLAAKVKKDLESFEIIHEKSEGLNVVVKFVSEEEKEKIINYCQENNLEWTECPRYIRVNEKAICIEVKRK